MGSKKRWDRNVLFNVSWRELNLVSFSADWLHGIEDRLDSKVSGCCCGNREYIASLVGLMSGRLLPTFSYVVFNWTALQQHREAMERNGGNDSGRTWSTPTEGGDVRRGATRVSLTCRTVVKTRGNFLRL